MDTRRPSKTTGIGAAIVALDRFQKGGNGGRKCFISSGLLGGRVKPMKAERIRNGTNANSPVSLYGKPVLGEAENRINWMDYAGEEIGEIERDKPLKANHGLHDTHPRSLRCSHWHTERQTTRRISLLSGREMLERGKGAPVWLLGARALPMGTAPTGASQGWRRVQ